MANAAFYQKRIDGCKKNLEKAEKKLARILKAEESNYEQNNPYYYTDYDKRCTLRELEDLKMSLEKYKEAMQKEIEKDNSRNVQVIIDFLNDWKQKVYSSYKKDLEAAHGLYVELREESKNCTYDHRTDRWNELSTKWNNNTKGIYEYEEVTDRWGHTHKVKIKLYDGIWEHIVPYFTYPKQAEGLQKLEKELEEEMKRKYDFIIERTNKFVGEIEDVSDLRVSSNGELNGFIIGTRGKAKVTTIIANGPIRIAHFRVLVKEVK